MSLKTVLAALAAAALYAGVAPAASAGSVTEIVHDMLTPGVTGSGVIKTQARSLEGFDVIESKGSIDLDVKIGPKFSVVVEADDNLLEFIRTEIHGDSLVVDSKGSWSTRHDTIVHVTLPHLLALGIQGSGDAHIADYSGDKLGVKIQGSGDVSGLGHAGALHVVIQGSGDVDFTGLDADDVKVRVDGSGDAKVTVNKTLEATIHGSGDVTWGGDGKVIDSQVKGSGEVRRR